MSNQEVMSITPEAIAKMSPDAILALFTQLKDAAKEAAKVSKDKAFPLGNKLYARVGKKGGLSIYGLGKFPTTYYVSGAERLFAPEVAAKVLEFIEAHRAEFTTKPVAETETPETPSGDTEADVQATLDSMETESAK